MNGIDFYFLKELFPENTEWLLTGVPCRSHHHQQDGCADPAPGSPRPPEPRHASGRDRLLHQWPRRQQPLHLPSTTGVRRCWVNANVPSIRKCHQFQGKVRTSWPTLWLTVIARCLLIELQTRASVLVL